MAISTLALVWFSMSGICACLRLLIRLLLQPNRRLTNEISGQREELICEALFTPLAIVAVFLPERQVAWGIVEFALTHNEIESHHRRYPANSGDDMQFFDELGAAIVNRTEKVAVEGARLTKRQLAWLWLQSRWAVVTAGLMGILSIPVGNIGKAFAQDRKSAAAGRTTITVVDKPDEREKKPPVTVRRSLETMVMSISPGPVTTVVSNLVVVKTAQVQASLRSNFFSNGTQWNQLAAGPADLPVAGTIRIDNRGNQWAGVIITPPVGRDATLAITGLKGIDPKTPDRLEVNATVQVPKTPLGLRGLVFLPQGRRTDAWVGPTLKSGDFQLWAGFRVVGPPGSNLSLTIKY